MPVASARTVVLDGAVAHLVDVQCDVSPGQVGVALVGRADAALQEAKDRCRMAIANSDLGWPATKRITISLAPGDLPKRGTHLDLAIALAVLGADGRLTPGVLEGVLFLGELSLDGALRPVDGVLPMVLAAAGRGIRRVVLPEPQAREAGMVSDVEVYGIRSLAQAVALLCGEDVPDAAPVAARSGGQVLSWRGADRREELDLADLVGMPDARYAVEVAAAGGHHLLLTGPKGSGKTSIAERLAGLLPDLTREESVEITALHSLAGTLDPAEGFLVRPPYGAPHHDASKAAIVGGGSGQVSPGELSRTHLGVLFLDEFPLFRIDVLEALRQPLESGEITIARRDEMITLPARGLLVLAANPCPCGEYRVAAGENRCSCRETSRRAYRARMSGPLIDRVDITRQVEALRPHERHDPLARSESTAQVRVRVEAARRRQAARYCDESWRLNAHVPGPVLRERWPLTSEARAFLDDRIYSGALTARGGVRVHRLAWTVADLARGSTGGSEAETAAEADPSPPGLAEVDVAYRLRTGAPLALASLPRAVG